MRSSERAKIVAAISHLEDETERQFMEENIDDSYHQGRLDTLREMRDLIESESYRFADSTAGTDEGLSDVS